MRGSPIGSSDFRADIDKKENPKQERDTGSDNFIVGCIGGRIFFARRLAEGHSQQRKSKHNTKNANDIQKKADVGRAHRPHGERRRRNRPNTPGQIHNAEGRSAARSVGFANP